MARWWRPHVIEPPSFQQQNAKASTSGFSRLVAPSPKAPPPVPDTPDMQTQRAAYANWHQQQTSRSNWDNGAYQHRHEGRGHSFSIWSHGQPVAGGTQYEQSNSTTGPYRYPDPWHPTNTPAGPPMPHPAERYPPPSFQERVWGRIEDPYYREPAPIIDFRDMGGPILGGYEDPGGPPYVEWPGESDQYGPQGYGRGGP